MAEKAAKAIARKPAAKQPKKSKRKPRQKSAVPRLTPRQGKFLDGIAQMETPSQAARDASYAESTARSAYRILEGANVRGEFQTLLRKFVDIDKIGQRLAKGWTPRKPGSLSTKAPSPMNATW